MRLTDYLRERHLTQEQFGQLLNPPARQTQVSHWITGRLRVSVARAVEIERLTDGMVRVEDWIDSTDPMNGPVAADRREAIDRRAPPCGGRRSTNGHKEAA